MYFCTCNIYLMAGIYIHIPFCKSKCNYCDFYSGTQFKFFEDYVSAVKLELKNRYDYLNFEIIETIYFGGGTPSILSISQISDILEAIYLHFEVSKMSEITFECNPENISPEYLNGLNKLGINRISIGIQSFSSEILKFLGRIHNAEKAENSVNLAIESGFENVSIDLIYAIPGMTTDVLLLSLKKAITLGVKHISLYNLTVSDKTKLHWKLLREKILPVNEDESVDQYYLINDFLEANGFKHYEISNYALDNYFSRHNMGYWNGMKYLGIGPSAHSFNEVSRQWNCYVLKKYINSINSGTVCYEIEYLSEEDRYNEYIITNLRTYIGLDCNIVNLKYSDNIYDHFFTVINDLTNKGYFRNENSVYYPDRNSLLKADYLSKYLMI
jgi:oxygen-independent coproporphyrinogen-3 oxidase